MSGVPPFNENEINSPKHMIIWLDKHIGKPEECILLKSSFFVAMDPNTGIFERSLDPDDINRSICSDVPVLIRLDDVTFVFQAFNDIEKCYETIEKNLQKRIFLITFGTIGKIIVPSLVKLYPETFPPDNPIYIFCGNLLMTPVGDVKPAHLWLHEFIENVLPFTNEDELLPRMVKEMADYFSKESQHLASNNRIDDAYQYQEWAQTLRSRHQALMKKK